MIIQLNGKEKQINGAITLKQLIESLTQNPNHIIAEVNESIVKTPLWESTQLNDGDKIELVTFVGGG